MFVGGVVLCRCVWVCDLWIYRRARPHRHRMLASDGVRYAGGRSSVGRRVRSVTKLRLEWYGGVFLLLQQRSKHPREIVVTPKASTSLLRSKSARYEVVTRRPAERNWNRGDLGAENLLPIAPSPPVLSYITTRRHIGWGGPSTGPTLLFYCSGVSVSAWAAAGRLLWWGGGWQVFRRGKLIIISKRQDRHPSAGGTKSAPWRPRGRELSADCCCALAGPPSRYSRGCPTGDLRWGRAGGPHRWLPR